jgi:CRISPR/Cas system-associated protein endoribonuclease Cas2
MDIKPHIPKIVVSIGVGLLAYSFLSNSNNNGTNSNGGYLPDMGTGGTIDAKQVAETLYDAMKTINWTNTAKNETIISALSEVTPIQFAAVIKAFGLRAYNPKIGNTYQYLWFKIKKHSLPFWLKYELNKPEYQLLKSRFSQYL